MHGDTEPHGGTPTARLRMQSDTLTLSSGTGVTPVPDVALAVGPEAIARAHFRHTPPTAYELESAIAAVEDEIMRQRGHVPDASTLALDDAGSRVLGRLADAGPAPIPLDAVERLFTGMVAAALRGGVEPPYDNDEIAAVLVIRELMHHLGFAYCSTIPTP